MPDTQPSALSVDQNRSLLRLYLGWPGKVDDGPEQEAAEFYAWLENELSADELQEIVGMPEEVTQFIVTHNKVLARARYLKGWHEAHEIEAREDPRTAVHTQVFFVVYDCASDPSIEGQIYRGIVLDTAPNGMRVESHHGVPQGAILAMTVVSTGQQMSAYHLTGEIRWHAEHSESHHMGVSIFNIEGFDRWREFHRINAAR